MILVKFTFGSFLNPPDKNTGQREPEMEHWQQYSIPDEADQGEPRLAGNYNFPTDFDTSDQVLLLFLLLTILTSEPGQLLLVKVYHHLRNLGFGFLGVDKISLLSASPLHMKVDIVLALPAQSYDFLSSQASAKPTRFVFALNPSSLASRFLGLTTSKRLGISPLVILPLRLGGGMTFQFLFFLKEFDGFLSLAKVVQGLPGILLGVLVVSPLHEIFGVAALLCSLVKDLLHLVFFLPKHHGQKVLGLLRSVIKLFKLG